MQMRTLLFSKMPYSNKPAIKLKGQKSFASGGNRLCFRHPESPERCLKVIRPDRSHLKDIRQDLATRSDPWQSFYAGKIETKKHRVSCSIDRRATGSTGKWIGNPRKLETKSGDWLGGKKKKKVRGVNSGTANEVALCIFGERKKNVVPISILEQTK